MTIGDHLSEFEGLAVVDYAVGASITNPGKTAYRLMLDWNASNEGKTFVDLLASFLADPAAAQVEGLLIGDWGEVGAGNDSAPVVEALVSARARLPKLRALFLGELVMEESEISWIQQSDVSPLFDAWPTLEALYIRGGNGLRLGSPRHDRLRKLVIETGGLPAQVVRDVSSAKLPQLTHLELWLGDDGYGNDIGVDDLRRLLAAPVCQGLVYLGLRDDCRADQTAQALREVGISASVRTLDLSLGTLGDEGAAALLNCSWLSQLAKLDIHHHYVSEELAEQLKSKVKDIDVDDRQEPDDWGDGEPHRYVSVSE